MSLRAVIYARCSTEEESQKDALAKQAAEARECVNKKGWILVDAYIESKSGTSTKGRIEYNRLYDDLSKDKFDVIVIKSQDRLMRNTKDWYLFVDRLTASSKRLYIYIEQKFYSADDALITGIKAILAEDYSRELSKKINNAHHNRQKSGGTVLLTNNTYGYRKLPDKSVAIVEEEAGIKRYMYELCAAGYGSRVIANIFKTEGIVNRKGNPFSDSDIRRMIRNPLNKGTVVMHRVHFDFDSKKVTKVPQEEQFIYDNKVPAIVSEELWRLANETISRRAKIYSNKKNCNNKEKLIYGKNSGKSALSGKIVCGICGAVFYRTTRFTCKDRTKICEWKCHTYLQNGKNPVHRDTQSLYEAKKDSNPGCSNIHLKEDELYSILGTLYIEETNFHSHKIISKIMELLEIVLDEGGLKSELDRTRSRQEQLKDQINALVNKLLSGVISDEVYQVKERELEEALKNIQEKIKNLEKKYTEGNPEKARIDGIKKFLIDAEGMQRAVLTGILDKIEKIFVYPDHLELIPGIEIAKNGIGLAVENSNGKIRVDIGNTFNYLEKKREEREMVVELMRENPRITAKQIAQELNITVSGANYRIKALKRDGRIRFNGAGGKGEWEVTAE